MKDYNDKIQDYCDGLLTGEELTDFEQRLATDPELQNLLELHREVASIVQKRERVDTAALRANLKSAETTIRQSQKRDIGLVVRFRKLIPAVAAACALLIFAVYYLRPMDDLYTLPTMRSEIVRGQNTENRYEDAVKAFNSKDYAGASEILASLAEQDSTNVQYRYYAALTGIGLENWPAAVNGLEPIASGESVFRDEAKYYLAVAYHESGKPEEAIVLLEEIPDSAETGSKAKKLLKQLRKR